MHRQAVDERRPNREAFNVNQARGKSYSQDSRRSRLRSPPKLLEFRCLASLPPRRGVLVMKTECAAGKPPLHSPAQRCLPALTGDAPRQPRADRRDGDHARVDAYVSLAVIANAVANVAILDPLIGLGMTVVILCVTRESWRTVRKHSHHH